MKQSFLTTIQKNKRPLCYSIKPFFYYLAINKNIAASLQAKDTQKNMFY